MKWVRFSEAGTIALGLLDSAAGTIARVPTAIDLGSLLAAGDEAIALAAASATGAVPLAEVALEAPLIPLRNIFCVGKNYRAHAAEFARSGFDATQAGDAVPDAPIIFTKAPTSVIGTGAPVPAFLDDTRSTDYEGELGVVIGRGGRGIAAANAFDHVFGYTIINDVTARTLQHRHRQWLLGKSIDGFCPMGPCVVMRDELGDLAPRELRTMVNGEVRQRSVLADMIFDVAALIETISKRITLQPGDVIATGTPEGVGIGFDPPKFLQDGDVVRVEIDGIGAIENRIDARG